MFMVFRLRELQLSYSVTARDIDTVLVPNCWLSILVYVVQS